jgi:DNA-binding IclR family transcriptional regulator
MVNPLARALALLSAFSPVDWWLGSRDLVLRTGLPPSTVTRIAQSLAALGYLHYDIAERKYRLAAPVLSLGYAAITDSDVQRLARVRMQAFADQHKVQVNLSSRERLDLVVLESCSGEPSPSSLKLRVGTRVGIASTPMGWALLAALPELERYYLLENVKRRLPLDWPRLQRCSSEAMAQLSDRGFCTSQWERARDPGIVAAPIIFENRSPLVLACLGSSSQMTRQRLERELGPRLLAMASSIQQAGLAE